MKSFTIDEVLIYSPTLKSKKKKPIESDIQQAKIMAFYPNSSPIQQKCNSVGMAEGVYVFCDSLLPQQLQQKTIQTIFMDQCCLVQKQVQENIWIFVKVGFQTQPKYKQKDDQQDQIQIQTGYINNAFTEQILQDFINHLYQSFKTFYGKIAGYLFLENLFQLQKTLDYFVPKYKQINSYPSKQFKLDISSYMLKMVRSIPLDVNTSLKFEYFYNIMQSYEPSVMDLIIFSNGYLAFTSLDKKTTEFFAKYLFGCVQPFRFQQQKIASRFRILPELPSFNSVEKYGSIFNSILFGFQDENSKSSMQDARSSLLRSSNLRSSSVRSSITAPFRSQTNQDLLGMEQKQQIQLIDAYLIKNQEQVKCKLNFFIQKNMVFLTFYREISTLNQLIFTNRFFHDNTHKFSAKISEIMSNVISQNDNYRFLFMNLSTCVGKCTFKDWSLIGNQIKYTLSRIKKSIQGQICTTFQNYWVYGIKRMNRILILLVPNDVPLHKIEQFTSKMTKQYFYKCFM